MTLMRRFVASLLVGLAAVAPAAAHPGPYDWPIPTVMRKIDGSRVTIGRWHHRIDAAATLCSGDGRPVVRSGVRRWKHFTCTETTFSASKGLDRDITFRVHVVSTRRFLITNAHFGSF